MVCVAWPAHLNNHLNNTCHIGNCTTSEGKGSKKGLSTDNNEEEGISKSKLVVALLLLATAIIFKQHHTYNKKKEDAPLNK